MNKYTIEITLDEVNGKTRYCAIVKEMPGWFVESFDLQRLFIKLNSAIGFWLDANEL